MISAAKLSPRHLILLFIKALFGSLIASLALASTTSGPAIEKLSPAIIKVFSTYIDEGPSHKSRLIEGTGFLVDIAGHANSQYVVTAAHVSQGKDIRIQLPSGEILKPKRREVDVLRDLEVIEVDRGETRSLGFFDPNSNDLCSRYDTVSVTKNDGFLETESLAAEGVSNLLYGTWAKADIREQYAYAIYRFPEGLEQRYHISVMNDELLSTVRVSAKMSGSPLIDYSDQKYLMTFRDQRKKPKRCGPRGLHIRGIAKQFNVHKHKSYFVPESVAVGLLRKIVGPAISKATRSQVRWRMLNGLLFRDLASGIEEANFIREVSGGERSESGGGDRTDSGGGDRTDSGGGDRTDSGSENPDLAWNRHGIAPGLRWHGKAVIAFKATSKGDASLPPLVIAANLAAINFMSEYADLYRFEPLELDKVNFIELLKLKMKAQATSRVDLVFEQSKKEPDLEGIMPHQIQIKDEIIKTVFAFRSTPVSFELDFHGRRAGEKSYLPIFNVHPVGLTEVNVKVEVSDLFMTDLSELSAQGARTRLERLEVIARAYGRIGVRLTNTTVKPYGWEVRVNFRNAGEDRLDCDTRYSQETRCKDDRRACMSDRESMCAMNILERKTPWWEQIPAK